MQFKTDGQLLRNGGLFAVEEQEGFFRKNFAGNLVNSNGLTNQNNSSPSEQNALGNVLGLGRTPRP